MNIQKITEKFSNYIKSNYDQNETLINLKHDHSLVVAQYSKQIAKELGLTPKSQDLAYLCGLFHDYSRFEQWQTYNSLIDHKTIDHGDRAVTILFDQNQIAAYDVPAEYHEVMSHAIKEHNKYKISTDIKNEETLLFCKIVRDADKTHNYEIATVRKLASISDKSGASKEVIDQFYKKQSIDIRNLNTDLDRALMLVGTIFDLHFDFPKRKIVEIDYFEKMYQKYTEILSFDDLLKFKECLNFIKNSVFDK